MKKLLKPKIIMPIIIFLIVASVLASNMMHETNTDTGNHGHVH